MTNHRRRLSANLPNCSVGLVKTRMSLCFIKECTVATYYEVELYLSLRRHQIEILR